MKAASTQVHYRTCNLCEAMCGVAIEVRDQEILSIKGDKNDPLSKGHICPKALALKDFHEDPDRLRHPIQKTEDGWKEISWNKAFDLIGKRMRGIQKQHGRHSVGVYLGNPNVHHHGNLLMAMPFLDAVNSRNRFSATSNDQLPHMRCSLEMFGHQLLFPVPDIDHTDLFILVGSNPAASNGSLMSAPDMVGRLKNVRRRGGEVILIDPRRTETARYADQHLFVKPGTDAFLFLGMIHTLFDEGLVETGRLTRNLEDIAQIQLLVADYAADVVAPLCGVDAETIRELARKLAKTPRAAIFGRMGTSTQEFGTLSTWFVFLLNILTNHLDERGGLMFTKPAADMIELSALGGQKGHAGAYHSSASKLPEFGGELPACTMAEQIETPGDMQIKAMFIVAGNPVLSSPNGERLAKAYQSLDFMVSIDPYLNETSSLADIILPTTSQLEQSHFDLAMNMVAVRNVAKYSPALFERDKNARHDWEILLELTRALAPSKLFGRVRSEAFYQFVKRVGPDGLLDLILRVGPYGTQIPGTTQLGAFLIDAMQDLLKPGHILRKLVDMGPYGAPNRSLSKGLCVSSLQNYPHGVDLGSLQSCLPERLYTRKKRVKLAPAEFVKDMSRLRKRREVLESEGDESLLLIGRRNVRSNNSWMHNHQRLVKGKDRCTALIHPDDAAARKLTDGDMVRVSTRIGAIELSAELSDEVMPGVVSVPHGWGHSVAGTQLSIASRRPGVSVNNITDDSFIDRLSGTAAFNGIPVEVVKVGAKASATAKRAKRSTSPASKTKATSSKSRVRVAARID